MPFIVYFFLTFLIIYIPIPTMLFFFFQLSTHYTAISIIYKLIILILLILDIKLGYGLLYNHKIKIRNYLFFLCLNLVEELIHLYFFYIFHKSILFILCIAQFLMIVCAFLFPISKKFRKYLL
ncbi:hypothetical protein IGJ53_002908 [Enterococcus sp. DIV1283b]|nr:hypothetical protein [Enterococcus faecium]